MRNIFITIEGVDGVGKTATVKSLAELMGATVIQTPSIKFLNERAILESECIKRDKFLFYSNAIIDQQSEIDNLLNSGSVVCDRYIHSTFAYQSDDFSDKSSQINTFFEKIRRPDYSFLLTAEKKERLNRIKSREMQAGFVNDMDYRFDVIDDAEVRYLSMSDLIHVDTSGKSIDEVCSFILKRIDL